jgi:hypothetical protein
LSHPGNKLTDPTNLPNPELNPLLNPILGQNLGRWAQVYFTNPPEKRDAAVLELLRELEGQNSAGVQTGSQARRNLEPMRDDLLAAPDYAPMAAEPNAAEASIVCPACQQVNPVAQKFCGYCGALLDRAPVPAAAMAAEQDLPSAPPAVAEATPESDIDWLRNSAIAGFDPDVEKQGGWWKYGVAGVLLLLAGFGYLEYVSRTPPRVIVTSPAATAQTQAPDAPIESQTTPPPAAAKQQPSDQVVEKDLPPAAETNSGAGPASSPVKAAAADSAPASPETNAAYLEKERVPQARVPQPTPAIDSGGQAGIDNGADDLKQAQDFLEGRNVPHDSAAAARLLWRAVSKQNTAATLMLADMYASGDGVTKSCDQARLLLVAATKKGSPEAADKLRRLESGSCR